MTPSPKTDALVQKLTEAIADLHWTSETDASFTVEVWPLAEGEENRLTSEQVLNYAQLPPETAIETLDLDTFFEPAIQAQSWHTPIEQAQVNQFQALHALLVEALTKIQVYRCGISELEIYIVGQSAEPRWVVLHTQAVET